MKTTKLLLLLFAFCSVNLLNATKENQIEDETSSKQINPSLHYESDSVASKQLYHITKFNNVEYVGEIISDDGREVLIQTEKLGNIYIPKSEIKSIEIVKSQKSLLRGEYYDAGPFVTRYAFTTNALPIKKGSNYALINLYGPEAHFALTDNFSVGILTTWLASPFVGDFKYSIKTNNEKLNFSFGSLIGTSGYLNTFKGYLFLPFGNVTFGDAKKNLTLAAGYGYLNTGVKVNTYDDITGNIIQSSNAYAGGPIFSIAGITKVGLKASFIFDSMIGVIHNNSSENVVAMFLMPGMRFQTNDKKAFQVSLAGVTVITPKDGAYAFPVPMCTWFYKF